MKSQVEELNINMLPYNDIKMVVASEKLFLNSLNSNFINEFKDEHQILLMNSVISESYIDTNSKEDSCKNYARALTERWEILDYKYRTFIGLGQDCLHFFNLYSEYKIIFDAAVFINFDWSTIDGINGSLKNLKQSTTIYNFYTNKKYETNNSLAAVQQYIPSRKFPKSPEYNKRVAQETAGVLYYGLYKQMGAEKDPSTINMILQ